MLLSLLRKRGHAVYYEPGMDAERLLELAYRRGIDVLVVRSRFKVKGRVLERLASAGLKVIARHGVGLDNIDIGLAERLGVKVVNAPGASTESVAELTVFLMIAAARRAKEAMRSLEEGVWARPLGVEIYGKRLAVVGFGRIGSRVAEIAVKAFNMDVHAYDVRDLSREARRIGVTLEPSLEKAIEGSDILSLHVPLTRDTWHMIGQRELDLLNTGAIVVNTARGGIIDEEALLNALESGKLGAAALDVFEYEPPRSDVEKKLIKHPRVVATPHIGAQTREAQERVSRILADNLERALGEAKTPVDARAWRA